MVIQNQLLPNPKKRNPLVNPILIGIILLALLIGLLGGAYYLFKPSNINRGENVAGITKDNVTWEEVVDLIADCKVTAVYQARNLEVSMTMKNGDESRSTKQPEIDSVQTEAKKASAACGFTILMYTRVF